MKITYPKIKNTRKNGNNDPGNANATNSNLPSSYTNDFFHLMAENSRTIIFHVHYLPALGFDYVSKSSTHITGYTPEEFYADPYLAKKCILPEDLHLLKDPTRPGAPPTYEPTVIRWKCKDGRIIWMEHIVTINRNERGVPESCQIVARDITEHKKNEEAIQIEKNKLQSVVDALADGLTIQDKDYNIIFQNEPARISSGGDHVGAKCYRVYENNENVCEGCPVALAFKDGKPHTAERKRFMPSGEISFWETTANPVRDAGGRVVSCLEIGRNITKRKKQEQALADELTRRRILVDQSRDGIVILDQNGAVYEANRRFAEMLGYSSEEILKLHVWEWDTQWTPEQLLEMIKTVNEAGDHLKTYHRRKDGTTLDVEISTNGVMFSGKKLVFCVCRDITERKKTEEALQESQKFVSSLLENAPHATVVINPDTSVRYVNPAWERLNGWTMAEVVGMKAPYPWWPEEYKETFLSGFNEAMKQGSGKGEVITVKKNGEYYWIDMNWTSVTNNGELQYLLINSIDITERKTAEEKRQAIIKTALDGFWMCDLDGKFLEVNDSYCKMTGYTQEELLKMSITDIEATESPEQISQRIKKIVAQSSDRFETQHKRKDGKIIDIEISAKYPNIGESQMFVFVRDITEHKAAEKAIQESEEKFSAAFHSSPDMISLINLKNGTYTDINDSFVHFTGYSREELIGHRDDDPCLWANKEEQNKMGRALNEHGKMRHEELHFRTKSGDIRTWLCSADIINIGGEPCLLAVATDITERKQAQEALLESEEKFSKAFHASPGSISISRLKDGKFIEVNDSFLRDKGYTREEIVGQSSLNMNIWANKGDGRRIIKILKEGGRVHNEVIQFRTKSGFIRTGLISAEIINIGNEPCMIVLNNDITQQKQAEEQLRLLSSVTQQVSDSIIITDPKFNITYINRAGQDLFGYTIDEVRGKNLAIFNKTPPTTKRKRQIFETVTQGKVYCSTVPKKRKDGSTIICDCRLSPLYDENGQICSYIDMQRDVTEQKEVEAKLQAQKQLIESILATMPEGVLVIDGNDRVILANESVHQIFHRSIDAIKNKLLKDIIPVGQLLNLHNDVKLGKKESNTLEFRYRVQNIEKLIICVAIKMDEERTLLTFSDVSREREEEEKLYLTDRLASIGEMAAGLAHELNNPLTGILSLSQLLIDSDIPEEPKEDLQCINSEAKRAASIVKNVLLFTRNNNYENGQASVNEVVKDVLRLREYEEKANNIKVVTNLQENLPDILIDKFQLQQVFLNIILNAEAAIKDANRPGLLTVTTEKVNHHINIMFGDNGCGIKKHVLPRIFDPFFTTKDIGKGTGLGLSICYGIVSKHGGKIGVKTQVNKGTTFTVRMPVVS